MKTVHADAVRLGETKVSGGGSLRFYKTLCGILPVASLRGTPDEMGRL